jgi:uncharacterized protein DUF3619
MNTTDSKKNSDKTSDNTSDRSIHHEWVRHEWVRQAKTVLDDSAQALDASTLSRLNRARQAALAQNRPRVRQRWFMPAGLAGACVLMLAVAVWHSYAPIGGTTDAPVPALTAKNVSEGDIDLVSSDDGLEFYQDLEFYAWLDAQDQGFDS